VGWRSKPVPTIAPCGVWDYRPTLPMYASVFMYIIS
jgi:hypothetical protein